MEKISELDTGILRQVEDAEMVLRALADTMEEKGAKSYAEQIRANADAVAEVVKSHPKAQDDKWDSAAIAEHRSAIRNA